MQLEIDYARDTLPRGILGMNASDDRDTCSSSRTAGSSRSGCRRQFAGVANPFPWMSEIIDLKKEKNFFETRVTEYRTGGALSWS